MRLFILVCAIVCCGRLALADDVGMTCGPDSKTTDKGVLAFGVSGVEPTGIKDVGLSYKGRSVSPKGTIFAIKNPKSQSMEGTGIVRYIVKDGDLTFTFSHLEKCGDDQSVPADFVKATVTKTLKGGKTKVLDQLVCACDID